MSVADLINILSQLPPDATIWRGYRNHDGSTTVVHRVESPNDFNMRLHLLNNVPNELIIEADGWAFGDGHYVNLQEWIGE